MSGVRARLAATSPTRIVSSALAWIAAVAITTLVIMRLDSMPGLFSFYGGVVIEVLVSAAAGLVVVAGLATLLSRSRDLRRIVAVSAALPLYWGLGWGVGGALVAVATGEWGNHTSGIFVLFGMIFGVVASAVFGLLAFLRLGHFPRTTTEGGVLGLVAATPVVLYLALFNALGSEYRSTEWSWMIGALLAGTVTGVRTALPPAILTKPADRS